jgi:ectoine hydroxylase-related dioxygenase (phytanoyl-CoA dioxygenase family)
MQHAPPLKKELMFEDIWANKLTATILNAVLGPNPRCNFADGNTALGDGYGGRQGVHADMAYNFPAMPCTITANYYLQDASKANGSTELWLGSANASTFRDHKACRELQDGDSALMPKKISLHTEDDNYAMEVNFGVREDSLERRRRIAPPVQPSVRKGSVMLRDLRLWHAGIANPSSKTRIMLNFIHTPWWYQVSLLMRTAGLRSVC